MTEKNSQEVPTLAYGISEMIAMKDTQLKEFQI